MQRNGFIEFLKVTNPALYYCTTEATEK